MDKLLKEEKGQFIKVATGFTTAFLGDERTLREFIVGDKMARGIKKNGENAILLLINDSYDPLTYGQLRLGANKDPRKIAENELHCGKPIAEVPDPFLCHSNYSEHFEELLLERLAKLKIFPLLLNSYLAYKNGLYDKYIATTFQNYWEIKEMLAERFENYTLKNLFRIVCPECSYMDQTHIDEVKGNIVSYHCKRCGITTKEDFRRLQGKLSWKLDCAARWNIYDVDFEVFSKSHVSPPLSGFFVSKFLSETYFGGKVPVVIRYGTVAINREFAWKLLDMLPPELLKQIFLHQPKRDIIINREYILDFAKRYPFDGSGSYYDFVQREAPLKNLLFQELSPQEKEVVLRGIQFGKYILHHHNGLDFPSTENLWNANVEIMEMAWNILRTAEQCKTAGLDFMIEHEIESILKTSSIKRQEIFGYLRRIFHQEKGPRMYTILRLVPLQYVRLLRFCIDVAIEGKKIGVYAGGV